MKLIHFDIIVILALLFVIIRLINSDELIYDNSSINNNKITEPIINKDQIIVSKLEIIVHSNSNLGSLEVTPITKQKISTAFGYEEDDVLASTTTSTLETSTPKTSSIRSSVLKIPLAFIQMLAFSMGLLCLLIP
ncbi:hypothetical protein CYY_005673 [Polysphondylium violaceum]|uniref:Uncharacterized protein n=1 Tax=Polysphondylium violaceum TaxID=133409 RepID=A0A8J4PTU3_9MYCE|nr:hypothetical protein CYY_005673 [Polysphondylium violaceum]